MDNNRVDDRAVIIGDVRMGVRNIVEVGAVLIGPLEIGDDNFFGPHCVVGAPAQDDANSFRLRQQGIRGTDGGLTIGSRNTVREFVTIHRGLTGTTTIADDAYLMAYAHIPHDCFVGDGVKLANNVQIGGYTWLGRGVYVGLSAAIHQFTVIGAYSMIGMGSVVTRQSIPPGSLGHGVPARLSRPNSMAMTALEIDDTSWWHRLASGGEGVEVPDQLRDDYAAFVTASNRVEGLRREVAQWRAEQRSTSKRG